MVWDLGCGGDGGDELRESVMAGGKDGSRVVGKVRCEKVAKTWVGCGC